MWALRMVMRWSRDAQVDRALFVSLGVTNEAAVKRCRPAIMRAFQAAKGVSGAEEGSNAAEYIIKKEFRMLLVYLKRYFELLAMFDTVDTGDDRRIDLAEFKRALPLLAQWGVTVSDAGQEFASIDENGGGQVS